MLAMERKRVQNLNTPEKLAQKFHSRADKSGVLQRFARKARICDKRQARRYAFHVASWFACAPPYYIPGKIEMGLLHKFLSKLGSGQLPCRLLKVLPRAQAALERMNLRGRALEQQRQGLTGRLRRFHCCRTTVPSAAEAQEECAEEWMEEEEEDEEEEEGKQGEEEEGQRQHEEDHGSNNQPACDTEAGRTATGIVEVESSEADGEAKDLDDHKSLCLERSSDGETEKASVAVHPAELAAPTERAKRCSREASRHLFRKINEWTNMRNREKLVCLEKLRLASIFS